MSRRTVDTLLFSPRPRQPRWAGPFSVRRCFANDCFARRQRNWDYASGNFTAAFGTIQDRPPSGADRCHCGCEPAVGRRVTALRPLPLVEAGNLKLLAVASSRRLPSLPDVPTIAETLSGFEAVARYAIMAPPGTPKNITDKINADVNEALRQPELQDRLRKLSAETFGGSVEKSAQYMREEVERWGDVIKAADIKLQQNELRGGVTARRRHLIPVKKIATP
jgi:Tripartite tricarboxylate transporter family receptor